MSGECDHGPELQRLRALVVKASDAAEASTEARIVLYLREIQHLEAESENPIGALAVRRAYESIARGAWRGGHGPRT